jgi:hypothetical protein
MFLKAPMVMKRSPEFVAAGKCVCVCVCVRACVCKCDRVNDEEGERGEGGEGE